VPPTSKVSITVPRQGGDVIVRRKGPSSLYKTPPNTELNIASSSSYAKANAPSIKPNTTI